MSQQIAANDRITTGVIWKEMLFFFLPIMFGTMLQQVYNLADTLIVGRFVGKQALAAVGGSAATIIVLLVHFFVALASGASVIAAQYYGANRKDQVRQSIQNAMALALFSGAILTVLGIILARPLLEMLHTTEDTMEYSVEYLRYYFLGMIPSMIYNMGSGLLRSLGDSKRPLQFLAVCAAVNIVLDLVFVIVLEMAVIGVAVATSISQLVCAVLVIVALRRLPEECRPDLKKLTVDRGIFLRMMKIGLPAGLQSTMYAVANMLIQVAINELGTDSVAGWAAYRKIDDLFWPINNAIGLTVLTFVGQNFGAQKFDRVKDCIRSGIKFHFVVSVFFSVVVISARYPLMSLFAKGDPAVIECGAAVTLYTSLFYFTFTFTEVLSAAMRAVGNALWPAVITLLCICVSRVVYLYAYVFSHLSDFTIALSYPVSWGLASLVFLIYYRSGKWMTEKLEH